MKYVYEIQTENKLKSNANITFYNKKKKKLVWELKFKFECTKIQYIFFKSEI